MLFWIFVVLGVWGWFCVVSFWVVVWGLGIAVILVFSCLHGVRAGMALPLLCVCVWVVVWCFGGCWVEWLFTWGFGFWVGFVVLWLLLIVHLVFPRVWMFCVGWYNTGSAVGGVGVGFVGDGFMVVVLRRVCWSVILVFVFCVLMVGFDLVCVSDFGNVVGCLSNCLGW